MGLDMYLTKKHYVKNWGHHGPEKHVKITVKRGGKKHPAINPSKITYITEEVGYWRKANHIHKWFVDNVQDGDDNHGTFYVDVDKLKDLLNACIRVRDAVNFADAKIKNGYHINEMGEREYDFVDGKTIVDPTLAEELLPTVGGFFFGSTDYDQYYMDDINDTIKILEDELELIKPLNPIDVGEYYYHASW